MMLCRTLIFVLSIFLISCSSGPGNKNKPEKAENISDTNPARNTSLDENPMIYFKGSSFLMGADNGAPAEMPIHQVEVKSFRINKFPVAVKEFRRFVKTTGYTTAVSYTHLRAHETGRNLVCRLLL